MEKKSKNWKKIVAIVAAVVVGLFVVVAFGAGNFMVNYSIGRSGDGGNRKVSLDVGGPKTDVEKIIAENMAAENARIESFVETGVLKETQITAEKNIKLQGYYAVSQEPTDNWVITVHGYKNTYERVLKLTEAYYSRGFNVLSPDLRACGKSEGKFLGMGWKDKDDILLWIDWILQQNPNAQIVVHGISMGAATTMMLSGENTPDNVVAFIEDCGYTSVWDIFSSEMKLRFNLPSFPILNAASFIAKCRAGYSFKEASALKQVKKCEKPMFFIHGSKDGFVPFYMMQVLYDAKPGTNKELHVAEGAGHDRAVEALGDEYWNLVFNFLNKYMN